MTLDDAVAQLTSGRSAQKGYSGGKSYAPSRRIPGVFGPPGGSGLRLLLDDLHLPAAGVQEMLREIIAHQRVVPSRRRPESTLLRI